MTSDTDALSDAVMNALWFTEFYRPTRKPDYLQPDKELNAGKLAREYVLSALYSFRTPFNVSPLSLFIASGVVASPTLDQAVKLDSRRLLNSFSRPSTFRLKPEMLVSSPIWNRTLMFEGILLVCSICIHFDSTID